MSKKKLLVLTGGGDCPGLNAVLRGIVKRSQQNPEWEVYGSIEAYNGVLSDPQEIVRLDNKAIAGIHVKGGTIIKTTNKGGPFTWPVKHEDGTWSSIDRSDDLLNRLDDLGITAVISIGGDGSQRISQKLYERGLDIGNHCREPPPGNDHGGDGQGSGVDCPPYGYFRRSRGLPYSGDTLRYRENKAAN